MSNELEKRFSTYLKKTLKGYSNRQKMKYCSEANTKASLSEEVISKISFCNYLQEKQELDNIDIDINHLEKVFTNKKYYLAMKKVPLRQRQVLYLLIVQEYTTSEVAKFFKTTPNNINKLKQKAIKDFKKNLEELKYE